MRSCAWRTLGTARLRPMGRLGTPRIVGPRRVEPTANVVGAPPPRQAITTRYVPRGFARWVAWALHGSSGHGCFGYRPFISFFTSA